jgi:putative ABC transport system permease protein
MVPVAISLLSKLELHGELLTVSVRATGQLVFIALILLPVFSSHWALQVLLVSVMLLMGAAVARERGKKLPQPFWTSILAILPSVGLILIAFITTGALEFFPNVIIPIAGMLIGNASRTIALLFHKTAHDFEAHQAMMEAMMLDGSDYSEAMRYPMQMTLKNALVPRIDSLKTLGIVHIPGAMAGMMIAGASPLAAAGYQILIFFGIISSASVAAIITNHRVYRQLFRRVYPHLL